MGFVLSAKSEINLIGIHPDLVKVARRALELTTVDFVVTEGLRTKERQRELVDLKKSRTMNSRHLTGHAVDVAALDRYKVSWALPLYRKIAEAFKAAGEELGVPVEWGGEKWAPGFIDGPHFQLPKDRYPG
jgi:peptidoglycan L-alanyl-D-glutamate endopeptidase CwlK